MGWLVAGAGAIDSNGCYAYAPTTLCCLAGAGAGAGAHSPSNNEPCAHCTVDVEQLCSRGPKEARLSFTANVSTADAHTVATIPPGLFELAKCEQAFFDESPPVWDDGRTGASTGALEVACCGPAAGWGRRFWARDQGDQRWGVLVWDASGREALSGPLALALPAVDGPSFRARRGRRDR